MMGEKLIKSVEVGKSNVLTIEHLMGFYTSTQLLHINLTQYST